MVLADGCYEASCRVGAKGIVAENDAHGCSTGVGDQPNCCAQVGLKLKMGRNPRKVVDHVVHDELVRPRSRPLHPVHHRDVQRRLARPWPSGYGARDRTAVRHDVVERGLPRLPHADTARAYKPGARPRRQALVSAPEPVAANVDHTVDPKATLNATQVVRAQFATDLSIAEERWVPHDRINLGPFRKERVGADNIAIEIIERQRRVDLHLDLAKQLCRGFASLVERHLLRDVQLHLGQLDGEGIDVDAVEVRCLDARAPGDLGRPRRSRRELADPREQLSVELVQLAERHVEEVPAAAGGVEHPETE